MNCIRVTSFLLFRVLHLRQIGMWCQAEIIIAPHASHFTIDLTISFEVYFEEIIDDGIQMSNRNPNCYLELSVAVLSNKHNVWLVLILVMQLKSFLTGDVT